MPRVIYVTESMHNIEQSGPQPKIPEGEYLLEVRKIDACSEKQFDDESKNPWMAVRATIVDGPVSNRPYSEMLSWSPNGQFRMGKFLAAFSVGRLKEGQAVDYPFFIRYSAAITKALAGKRIGAYIQDNEYDGRVGSQAMEFYPAADYEKRKGNVSAVVAAASNGSAAGSPTAAVNPLAAFEGALGDLLPQGEGA